MSYLTTQDLLDELGERELGRLTSGVSGGTVDETRAQTVIANATGVFETYIRSRYSLPVPTTPLVKQLVKKLAIYELYERFATTTDEKSQFGVKRAARDQALAILKDISMGRAALDVPAAEETKTNPATPDKILTNEARSKFSDEKLSSF